MQLYIRRHVYAVVSIVVLVFLMAAIYSWITFKTISLNVDGTMTVVKGLERGDVKDLLRRQGIPVTAQDAVLPSSATVLHNHMTIQVRHVKKVTLQDGGSAPVLVATHANTVGELLSERKIEVTKNDYLNMPRDSKLASGQKLMITRHVINVVVTTETIPFQTERQPDASMMRGQEKVLSHGVNGTAKITTTLAYLNGKLMQQEVQREIVSSPKAQKVAYGTAVFDSLALASRGSASFAGANALSMIATGYTASGNRTATGMTPHRGIAAVDPSVIPLGTRLYIEGYGYAMAEDTGGAIKGNRIDLYFDSEQQAIDWGRRRVTVYELSN